jgi:hypothetical protein
MTLYTHTPEQHAQLKAIRLQLIDLGDTKTAAMLDWVEEAESVGWRPIETALQTGATVLLGYLNRAGKWRTVRGQWFSQAEIDETWEEPDDADPGWFETSAEADDVPNVWPIDPTHWMPLPQPPES